MGTRVSHLTAAMLTSMINLYVCLNNNFSFNDTVAGVIKGLQVLCSFGLGELQQKAWMGQQGSHVERTKSRGRMKSGTAPQDHMNIKVC